MDSTVKPFLDAITDVRASINEPGRSLQFPGPVVLQPEIQPYVAGLLKHFMELQAVDATLHHEGLVWRGHLDRSVVDGPWVNFRKMPEQPPTLDTLPSPLPTVIREWLLKPSHSEGGLMLVAGPTGAGEDDDGVCDRHIAPQGARRFRYDRRAAAGAAAQRLAPWGHKKGYCSQAWVKIEGESPWAAALTGVLRSQAAGTPTMLFVGEIREAEAARVALQAAGNGFLVICTSFATDTVSAVSSFAKCLDESQQEMFSLLLRGVVFQKLDGKLLTAKLLESTLAVQQAIAAAKYASLEGEAQRQANERMLLSTRFATH